MKLNRTKDDGTFKESNEMAANEIFVNMLCSKLLLLFNFYDFDVLCVYAMIVRQAFFNTLYICIIGKGTLSMFEYFHCTFFVFFFFCESANNNIVICSL